MAIIHMCPLSFRIGNLLATLTFAISQNLFEQNFVIKFANDLVILWLSGGIMCNPTGNKSTEQIKFANMHDTEQNV